MFCHHVVYSLHCSYYGPGAVPSVEESIRPVGAFTTDAEIENMIGPVRRTDLIGAAVKGIGGYLRLVHSAEEPFIGDLTPMPQDLADLLRRAA
jgi:hypothetical protein